MESISVLSAEHDLLVYDLGESKPVAVFVGGQILRNVQGRIRQFHASGTTVDVKAASEGRSKRPSLALQACVRGSAVSVKPANEPCPAA